MYLINFELFRGRFFILWGFFIFFEFFLVVCFLIVFLFIRVIVRGWVGGGRARK